jgi:hypothetical protein
MIPSRHAGVVRAPAIVASQRRRRTPDTEPRPTTAVLPLARRPRYRGRLRHLAPAAPAGLRERIMRELRGCPSR